MWKKGTGALGILALVLAGPAAVGQEKPKVVGPEPVKLQQARMIVLNRMPVWSPDGERITFTSVGRWVALRGSNLQPLMFGGLEQAVEKMEEVLEDAQSKDVEAGLAAVDAIGKTVMEARRILRTERLALVEAGEQVAAPQPGDTIHILRRALNPTTTPLQKAWAVARDDVSLVRQAMNLEEASEALDEVEKSLSVLRALFWKKASKRD